MLSADSIKGKKELRSTMNYVLRKASDDDASSQESTKLLQVQLNKYETAPNFIQLNQNLTWDCLLI